MSVWARACLAVAAVAWLYMVTLGLLGLNAMRYLPDRTLRTCFGLSNPVPEIDPERNYYR